MVYSCCSTYRYVRTKYFVIRELCGIVVLLCVPFPPFANFVIVSTHRTSCNSCSILVLASIYYFGVHPNHFVSFPPSIDSLRFIPVRGVEFVVGINVVPYRILSPSVILILITPSDLFLVPVSRKNSPFIHSFIHPSLVRSSTSY